MSTVTEQWGNIPWVVDSGVNEQEFPRGALYVVGLPIGNAADITLRALWILGLCDCVAAEDTRQTQKILAKYGISARQMSVREFNEVTGAQSIIECLKRGERVALVTDAGTPAVSDPGALVVRIVLDAGFRVIPIPGACAAITALSASGLKAKSFAFVGFLPPQEKGRREQLARFCGRGDAFVLYEAPHRIRQMLEDLAESLDPDRRVVIARELTKHFESFSPMTASRLAEWAASHEPKGEYVVLVDEQESSHSGQADENTQRWLRALAEELPASRAASVAARVSGVPRKTLYELLLKEKK